MQLPDRPVRPIGSCAAKACGTAIIGQLHIAHIAASRQRNHVKGEAVPPAGTCGRIRVIERDGKAFGALGCA